MKKLIKYLMSFSLVFLLFPVSVFAHGPGEKVSVPCSSKLTLDKSYDDMWEAIMWTNVALSNHLLKSHNALNEEDGKHPIPIEVEITTKDGEKIPMIVGYNYDVSGGSMSHAYQTFNDLDFLFKRVSEAEKDEKLRNFGEFLNITCAFRSQ